MRYQGVNEKGFERDARLLNEWNRLDKPSESDLAEEVGKLADDYHIDRATIWDMIPEYDY